ncbi:MAG: serine/threonine protein phosphatase [Rhodobacteraceae bacterium]|nr:serine/threonine protein phosphatase [Paracoccaceae bacterium]
MPASISKHVGTRPLLKKIKKLLGVNPPISFPPPSPDAPFFAIGDVHGRLDLLDKVLDQLQPGPTLVLVGDYVDRGENSAGVLRRLFELSQDGTREVICLKGNHEDMMLRFLDDPEHRGGIWLRNGGLQTLASFGVSGVTERIDLESSRRVSEALAQAMGPSLISWIRALPHRWQSGNVAVVHAGADPSKPIAEQELQTLIWGHADFPATPRRDGQWILHGHTIMDQPVFENGIISVDTGAYATGRLTAAGVSQGNVEFLTT